MYAADASDELPKRLQSITQKYRVRQVLWREYGLSWPDWTFEEIIEALELSDADSRRYNAQIAKLRKKPNGR